MKSKMKKKMIAFLLCMVLVICNSVSILADTPAAETTTTEKQAKETRTAKNEGTSEEEKSSDNSKDTSKSSEETEETKEEAPETKTTEKKEETTGATTEKKEESATATTTEKKEETEESSETSEKKETEEAEETATTGSVEETSEASEETTESKETSTEETGETTQSPAFEGKYEDTTVTISVSAEAGIVPEGAELSVTPIEKTEITDNMTEDEKAEAEEINAQYDLTEKKLTEDSEANEETMEGFLAYDISFIVDGEEVEPNGDVKVIMDFKEAAVPEGVSEDAAVAVKHLKEVESAADGVVVEDMAGKSVVQTTDKAEIEKIELTSNSFSTYTVTWTISSRSVNITAHYGYLGTGSKFVEFEGTPTNKIPNNSLTEWKNLNNYSNENIFGTDDGYQYLGAYIMTNDNQFVFSESTKVQGLCIKEGRKQNYYLYYRTGTNGSELQWGSELSNNTDRNVDVYYIYDKLTTVETIDNASAGITMSMKNYSPSTSQEYANGIYIGGSYSQGNVKQGLLKRVLEDDFPVTQKEASLSSLFSGGTTVDNLFIKNTYDETGYYEYSSFQNYAYLDGNKFTVYEQLGTPSDHKNDTTYYFNRGNFLPYNQLDVSIDSGNYNLYGENSNTQLANDNVRKGERLYTSQDATDYYFGMYMDVNFTQPEDGIATHTSSSGKTTSNPMIYEFNGDDDLWVYIDDVLVLDIGGVHDAHSGYINFANGKVHVEYIKADGTAQDTTIKEMFRLAGKFPDGSEWDDAKVDNYFDGYTFRDFSVHNMKMFYMERGAGASNLHMRFNLQTVPEGTIEVTKDLTNTDKENYANVEFAFQVYAQGIAGVDNQGNETYSEDKDDYVLLNSSSEGITATKGKASLAFKNDVQIGDETYDSVFYLKPGETAQFSGLQKNRKYYVKEIGVNPGEYDQVIINGTEIISVGDDGETSKIQDITSTDEEVRKRPSITFQNSCTAANRRELQITKHMKEGQTTRDTFTFNVWLEGTDGSQSPYNGSYYLTRVVDGEKTYYHYDTDGKLTAYEGTEKDLTCGTTSNGQISGVPVGYTVAITGILSGTSFFVTEANPGTNYQTPEKALMEGTYTTEGKEKWADGEILLGEDAKVTITNSLNQDLKVTKEWVGADTNPANTTTIYVGLYKNNEATERYATLSYNNWTYTFENVDSSYSVKELRPVVNGETKEFTINGTDYIGINEGASISVSGNQYTVDYETITTDQTNSNQLNATIKNIQKWQIVKRKSDENTPLPNAEFELTLSSDGTTYSGESGSDGVIAWKDSSGEDYTEPIPDGTYTLEETKAPTGYILGGTWTITITDGIPTAVNPAGNLGTAEGGTTVENGSVTFYNQNGILTLYYDNEVRYNLPSAGGPGIYWYTLSGTLLMAGAALIVYRQKRKREVLLRK